MWDILNQHKWTYTVVTMHSLIRSHLINWWSFEGAFPSAPASVRSAALFCLSFHKWPQSWSQLSSTTWCCVIPALRNLLQCSPRSTFTSLLLHLSCSSTINQNENNISVLRHSVPLHSCGSLSSQIHLCRSFLAQAKCHNVWLPGRGSELTGDLSLYQTH